MTEFVLKNSTKEFFRNGSSMDDEQMVVDALNNL